jgi:hypothetical protein
MTNTFTPESCNNADVVPIKFHPAYGLMSFLQDLSYTYYKLQCFKILFTIEETNTLKYNSLY